MKYFIFVFVFVIVDKFIFTKMFYTENVVEETMLHTKPEDRRNVMFYLIVFKYIAILYISY
jgi:hypothetical protein